MKLPSRQEKFCLTSFRFLFVFLPIPKSAPSEYTKAHPRTDCCWQGRPDSARAYMAAAKGKAAVSLLTWSLTLFPLVISAQHSMAAGMAN